MSESGEAKASDTKNLDSNAPPQVSKAPTSRAKCQICKEPINSGDTRVSLVGRSSGVSVLKHLHPSCFCTDALLVDYAPTGRERRGTRTPSLIWSEILAQHHLSRYKKAGRERWVPCCAGAKCKA